MIDNTVHHITLEADTLLDEVEILYRKFEYEAAEQILRNILSMLEHHLHRDDLGDALDEASLKHTIISHMSRVYNYFAAIADSRAEYANALHYAEIGISYCDQANNEIIKIRFLQLKGNVYKDITDNSRAIECFHQCIELCEKHNKLEILAYPLGSLGNMYSAFGDFTKAIEYYTRALEIDEKINHKEGIARNLGNMANLYGRLSIPTKAFEYLLRSLEINEEIGNKAGIAINLGNIGEFYLDTGDYHTALEYFNRALALSLEVSALRPAGFWMLGIATVELKMGNTEAALEGLNATLDFRRNVLNSNEGVTDTLLQLGLLLREIGNPEESIMRLSEGIALAEELEEKTSIASLSEALAESYFALGDGMKAYELHKKFYELDSAVKNEETKKQADKFDTDRKQAESEKQIAVERARAQATDEILANILPASIVERLIKERKK
ncbi:MAG: tetratricopeptide repeat protein [Ignavibacteria bacterium]|nr:tetratricopeptide repeat protein [Ignavibacteria bacterium]